MNRWDQPTLGGAELAAHKIEQARQASASPTHQSLAAFMGGKSSGPRLNRPVVHDVPSDLVEQARVPTFLSQRPGVMNDLHESAAADPNSRKYRGVALPGMVPARSMTVPGTSSAISNDGRASVADLAAGKPETPIKSTSLPSNATLDAPKPSAARAFVRDRWVHDEPVKAAEAPQAYEEPSLNQEQADDLDWWMQKQLEGLPPSDSEEDDAPEEPTTQRVAPPQTSVDAKPASPTLSSVKDSIRSWGKPTQAEEDEAAARKAAYKASYGVSAPVQGSASPSSSYKVLEQVPAGRPTDLPIARSSEVAQPSKSTTSSAPCCFCIRHTKGGRVMRKKITDPRPIISSGYSYILSSDGQILLWHGRGTMLDEQRASSREATAFSKDSEVEELRELHSDENKRWWSKQAGKLASAHYWRAKRPGMSTQHAVYHMSRSSLAKVDEGSGDELSHISTATVSVIDLAFELFVIVPTSIAKSPAKVQDIRSALQQASHLAQARQSKQHWPYLPPVHALVFPTLVPMELAAVDYSGSLRQLNGSDEPREMNILTHEEAMQAFA
ncbi:uncharacterized protein L969DRAFT_15045 [Mixia osmundae IAM 14324]|uniref:Gelsolin-like domain-containing protein n=1 Tax=Mixia osmundae (strain CBS 9802 / IAM 14324 / JCM 22182 / KY 12970) TaxID=764103 RepID=G7DTH0_MIXOS|nr:uncharacterized protein L969DRAFT_15045 [Mixia osmundae IAM 14324]KEI42845.1 hypothetical protein L969DRAFT_15045 [Mixia osmundae IAM 14324]GAA93817.1 hypothetical protein E5Q_00463 [Mixia osmundae IAM 14324]